METLRISFLSGSVLELAATIGVALVAVTAGVRLVDGSLGLQAGLTVIILAPELYLPFRRLGAEYHASADGLAVAERMFALLDAPAAVGARRPAARAEPGDRRRCGSSRSRSRTRPVPARCSTGSTSSSRPARSWPWSARAAPARARWRRCCSACCRRPSGRITVGDVDLSDCELDAWRRLVAWVPQHPTLFRASVADNIRLGDPEALAARRSREAAALAGADEFISALPDGYATAGRRRGASRSRRASAAGSGSRGRSSATRRS